MDQATIEAIVKAIVAAINTGFDWKLAFAGLAALAALISAVGAILTSIISLKTTKITLNHTANQKWANQVIESFSNLDGQDRGMIKETLSFKDKVYRKEKAGEAIDHLFIEHNMRMDDHIKKHGRLLTQFRLLFDPNNPEFKSIIEATNGYNTNFLKRFGGDYSDDTRNNFDSFTNELCNEIGAVIHKYIKI